MLSNNELLLLHSCVVFGFCLVALKMGAHALIAFMAVLTITANLFVLKQVTLFGLDATCSDVYMLGTVLCQNWLQEFFSREQAKQGIIISFCAMGAFAALAELHLGYQPNAADWTQAAYKTLLSNSPRLLIASMLTFWLVQMCDLHIFSRLRAKLQNWPLALRSVLGMIPTQALDTALFTFLGLYGLLAHLQHIMVVSFSLKILIALCSTPFSTLAKRLLKR